MTAPTKIKTCLIAVNMLHLYHEVLCVLLLTVAFYDGVIPKFCVKGEFARHCIVTSIVEGAMLVAYCVVGAGIQLITMFAFKEAVLCSVIYTLFLLLWQFGALFILGDISYFALRSLPYSNSLYAPVFLYYMLVVHLSLMAVVIYVICSSIFHLCQSEKKETIGFQCDVICCGTQKHSRIDY